jgi:hypothetical protein
MSSTATVELSADPERVTNAVAELDGVTVDMLLPGTLLRVSVSKVKGTKLKSVFAEFSITQQYRDVTFKPRLCSQFTILHFYITE